MARTRQIKPSFFDNEVLGAMPALTRLFFIGLWGQADRHGILEDRPARLRAKVLPFDHEADGSSMIETLMSAGFVLRYSVGGESFLMIQKFAVHQRPHPEEKSTYPRPPRKFTEVSGLLEQAPVKPEQVPATSSENTASCALPSIPSSPSCFIGNTDAVGGRIGPNAQQAGWCWSGKCVRRGRYPRDKPEDASAFFQAKDDAGLLPKLEPLLAEINREGRDVTESLPQFAIRFGMAAPLPKFGQQTEAQRLAAIEAALAKPPPRPPPRATDTRSGPQLLGS